jgi:hypothetical protein
MEDKLKYLTKQFAKYLKKYIAIWCIVVEVVSENVFYVWM